MTRNFREQGKLGFVISVKTDLGEGLYILCRNITLDNVEHLKKPVVRH